MSGIDVDMRGVSLTDKPFVSAILPCLNEESFISQCLDSILLNDYPQDLLEVLVVDGMSEDGTREIVGRYVKRYKYVRMIDNERRITPCALNMGIENSIGDIILRLDAHATYHENYISRCVDCLLRYGADNVGGSLHVEPRINSLTGQSIAQVFSCPLGSGNAYYKTADLHEPKWVDTVPFGCYRREVFSRIGLFNENLKRSQDMEFNKRLISSGGKILLIPDIKSTYYVRSDYWSFLRHNISDGAWALLPFLFAREPVSLRHLIPFFFTGSIFSTLLLGKRSRICFYLFVLIASLYSVMNLFYSISISIKANDYRLIPYCLMSFLVRHFGYGLGSICALPKVMFSRRFWAERIVPAASVQQGEE